MPAPYTTFTYGDPLLLSPYITIPMGAISAVPVAIESLTLKSGVVGTPYSATVGAVGGTGPYTFALISGTLPTSLSLNASTGVISGTPTVAGTYSPAIRATDSLGALSNSVVQSISIASAPTGNPVIPLSPGLPSGTIGVAYSQTIDSTGGTGPFTYAISSGSLPNGLTLDGSTGVVSGTPTTAGSISVTIQSTDSLSVVGTKTYTITISAAISDSNSGFIS